MLSRTSHNRLEREVVEEALKVVVIMVDVGTEEDEAVQEVVEAMAGAEVVVGHEVEMRRKRGEGKKRSL